jgi:hypothetical protein
LAWWLLGPSLPFTPEERAFFYMKQKSVMIARATGGEEISLIMDIVNGSIMEIDAVAVMPDMFWWMLDSHVQRYRVETSRVRSEYRNIVEAVIRYDALRVGWGAKEVKVHEIVRIVRELIATGEKP